MTLTIGALLALSFLISVLGLFLFIWAQTKGLMRAGPAAAEVIFAADEVGVVEDPAAPAQQLAALQAVERAAEHGSHDGSALHALGPDACEARLKQDRSSRTPAFAFLSSSIVWLVLGSLAGLIASQKLTSPDFLAQSAWLTFGRIRTAHLNMVAYGWASMAGLGVVLWMLPRLLCTELVGARFATLGALVWNGAVAVGVSAILCGWTDGQQWLEIPWQIGILFAAGGALCAVPLLCTLRRRTVDHLYVSVWYASAALLWFPILYVVAKVPHVHSGVEQAIVNWWYAHNVLGLWLTPIGLASAYYFIAKVLGRPIYSYSLSLVGFWALAMFYSQAGVHHLIGGPVPGWLVSVSVVQSVMMVVPVLAVGVNQHMTMVGRFAALRHSPTLRFVVLGTMLYTLVSLQGSLEAVPFFNRLVHFTQYKVAHAHLGVYGFFSMIMFGSIYFIMPRVLERMWPYPRLIAAHFWLVCVGFAIYFVALTIGGVLQGIALLDASRPFIESVTLLEPWMLARTVGGALMTLGHVIFAGHFLAMVFGRRAHGTGHAGIERAGALGVQA
ncbi:cbb3-type cytochrome c oxidase subunit I [Paraburkholderia tagetis]|uniref:Cbb3-type cytochrome c oxidase subunit I n=1 Tax=Paraburkholderia tagetis TaxID=2913261 RepID=A0A9X1UMM2_9BURK|nr:cbb3-type cytochrome c oxidase subunit I [Paraburkholderia tagetis]MCG5078148.1 cbb3-type cytochrome c oxidase subunit I [Paraburkholderia tagetis]